MEGFLSLQGFSAVGDWDELACVRSSHACTFFWDESSGDHLVLTNTDLDAGFIQQFCVHHLFEQFP